MSKPFNDRTALDISLRDYEIARLKAENLELRKRVREGRRLVLAASYTNDANMRDRAIMEAAWEWLYLRRPLPKRGKK